MTISKKEMQRRRKMAYFIDAAHQIIDQEGIENLTIRRVADLAGYNSATIYNYFTNQEHLISYAAIKYLKEYYLSLEEYIKNARNAYERFILIWEKFCIHSYQRPEIYRIIFFSGQSVYEIFDDYFKIFPSDFGEHSLLTLPMLSEHNILDRNKKILEPLANEGFFKESNIDEANEMIISLYRGILALILEQKAEEEIDVDKEVKKTIAYIERILKSFQI